MATLYVESVPDDLYGALRERAKQHRKSISAEVLALLEEMIPTASELARRREVLKRARQISRRPSVSSGPFQSAEEMQREDRLR
jgi:plasmid stability protein